LTLSHPSRIIFIEIKKSEPQQQVRPPITHDKLLARKAIVFGTGMVFFAVRSFSAMEIQTNLKEIPQNHSDSDDDIFW